MQSLKAIEVVLFSLIVLEVSGLNYEGCHRLREVCRNHVDCDYEALYHLCGKFMVSIWDETKGDPLAPMPLVKAWLFFPEALHVYKKKKPPTNRHVDGDFNNVVADLENGEFGVKHYSNDIIQRVKRVLNFLEEKNTEEKNFAYGSEDSRKGNSFENDDNFGSNSNIIADKRQTDSMQDDNNVYDPDKITNWNDGIDIRVAKSDKMEAGYDMYHLMQRNPSFKYSRSPSPNNLHSLSNGESDQDGRPQSFVNIETKRSREMLHAADLNNHNKEHLKIIERSEADVLPDPEKGTLILQFSEKVKPAKLETIASSTQKVLWGINSSQPKIITKSSIDSANSNSVLLQIQVPHTQYTSAYNPKHIANRINTDKSLREKLSSASGLTLVHARSLNFDSYKLPKDKNWDEFAVITAIVGGSTLALIVAALVICTIKRHRNRKLPIELHKKEALTDYEELCRTQMALNAASPGTVKALNADKQRHGLVNGQGKYTKKTWREEPLAYNMDISTGHVILAYLEEHLKDEDKLSKEWEALCNYQADQNETTSGEDSRNAGKNRYSNVLPYDHTRVKLRETSNIFHSDYINANFITDSDPRNPCYIATQGPLDNTIADFWQMIWEQGVVVIVNLTRLSDMGLPQCQRYWPEEGNQVYNTYQVHLISEHIWCDDYIVRSFYLKHLATQETRTITQFHFLTWPDLSVPESAKPLLEFRRKVNKCYRGQACPIVVHCNNGVGRTGTYILIDMVLKKMIKGTKEIDIAATLEYLRDQRPDMVKAKAQFEFCLAAVAEEVTAILSSLSN